MRRVTELDSIRGLAALAVMIYHLDPPAYLFKGIRVDLFLILSGYLVTTIILNKGNAANFYPVFQMRRALRIWPLYYLTLAALVAVNAFLIKSTTVDALPNYLTFTQNIQRYWSDSVPGFKWYYMHTWSLALEQQFYLIWPLVFVLLGRRRLVGVSLAAAGHLGDGAGSRVPLVAPHRAMRWLRAGEHPGSALRRPRAGRVVARALPASVCPGSGRRAHLPHRHPSFLVAVGFRHPRCRSGRRSRSSVSISFISASSDWSSVTRDIRRSGSCEIDGSASSGS